ncbi:HvfC/BufC family peptide modification chaperone [Pseudomonas sp. NUPR-001]|uniref:HvfC/BufC family peptide modification chaperone n=1 Tax=Pseudomonas sp. NUPR-001 TaxID=3416058 RepID=UPI003F9B2C67
MNNVSLGAFQSDFIAALYGHSNPSELLPLTRQAGFTVYRNTVLKGCVDALQANFPSVERLVGNDWFRAAAAIHAVQAPPSDARLILYGEQFAAFLEQFEPAQSLPYLADVARADRLWIEVHIAAQDSALDVEAMSRISPEHLGQQQLRPRTDVRWQWFAQQPIYSIWHSNRQALALPEPLDWHGEGMLLRRQAGQVLWQPLGQAECIFLDACAAGLPLEAAANQVLAFDSTLNFTTLLGQLLAAEVFA